MAGFTLEAVAERAAVTSPLLRHYFGSRDRLLIGVGEELIAEVRSIFFAGPGSGGLEPRLASYLEFIDRHPWAHAMWLQASQAHPELGASVTETRRSLAALSMDRPWPEMDAIAQLEAIGWVGYVESVVAAWIDGGRGDRRPPLRALAGAAGALGVRRS